MGRKQAKHSFIITINHWVCKRHILFRWRSTISRVEQRWETMCRCFWRIVTSEIRIFFILEAVPVIYIKHESPWLQNSCFPFKCIGSWLTLWSISTRKSTGEQSSSSFYLSWIKRWKEYCSDTICAILCEGTQNQEKKSYISKNNKVFSCMRWFSIDVGYFFNFNCWWGKRIYATSSD